MKRGEGFLENYTKVILYAYPLLRTVGEDYADHIKNKATLSYNSTWDTERLAEYLVEEILRKERLEWLKEKVEEILRELDEGEKAMFAVRYFGKNRRRGQGCDQGEQSEREYFRRQTRLAEKLSRIFAEKGVTEDVYLHDFADLEIFNKIHRFVEEGKDKKRVCSEWRFG